MLLDYLKLRLPIRVRTKPLSTFSQRTHVAHGPLPEVRGLVHRNLINPRNSPKKSGHLPQFVLLHNFCLIVELPVKPGEESKEGMEQKSRACKS